MTKETMRLLVEWPELLNRISIEQLHNRTPREILDLPEPQLLVTELGPMGVAVAVIFPMDDYRELCEAHRRVFEAIAALESLGLHRAIVEFQAVPAEPCGTCGVVHPNDGYTGWLYGGNYKERGRLLAERGTQSGEPWYEDSNGMKSSGFDVTYRPDCAKGGKP